MQKVGITETVLRDAQQSLIATRMPYSDFEGILKTMNEAGYYSVECWGGATFDTCLRYLNEDPWERLRKIRAAMPDTKLQMLLRGQNLLGYKPYPDDVVEKFVEHSLKNGIDIIRIFDALNDPRNLEVAVKATKKFGGIASGTICFTISPVHTLEKYIELGNQLRDMGCDSICIKDMAGIMGPQEAYDLVHALKQNVKLPVIIHTHSTTGLAPLTLLKSVEAGADVIDTAISSMSGGSSQYATESMAYALRQLGYGLDVDDKKLKEIADYFAPIQKKGIDSGLLDPYVLGTKAGALVYQIPGGMISNLITQLKQQNAADRLDEVLLEVPRVKADLGHPPLVTPTSQICGVQAVMNVLTGERYKMVSNEVRGYLRGEYGRAPGEVNPEVIKKVLKDEKPSTERYADRLAPAFESTKRELGAKAKCDEDVLSYLVFPQLAEKYFEKRDQPAEDPAAIAAAAAVVSYAAASASAAPASAAAPAVGVKVGYSVRRLG
ncbi:pyruvate carboxylase subunit B [Yanshouia hominis]|uniref:Pyruvate carboxylase subunit B n=2 Tax=Oscillospiraceae TaxID=216572 RepID=A0ABR7NGQ9_9FIRM|nr:pyruvate carboxylase subunit B [Yanshouia hominis]MBC8575583.1 pyruvate carboxylase subunit B [Yanshouia hominis]